jgi:CheY-like chemotaxis protein
MDSKLLILIGEDNEGDALLIQAALQRRLRNLFRAPSCFMTCPCGQVDVSLARLQDSAEEHNKPLQRKDFMSAAGILVAEDIDDDVQLLKAAWSMAGVDVPLYFVKNGGQVVDYLKGDGWFADRARHPLPKLLLLDLHMPILDGFEVLQWLRGQTPPLDQLPVIVFTSSPLREDFTRALEMGARSCISKPTSFERLQRFAHEIAASYSQIASASASPSSLCDRMPDVRATPSPAKSDTARLPPGSAAG